MASPTKLTLDYFRKRGTPIQVSEKWVSFGRKGGIRRDLFGGDLIALFTNCTLSIQAGMFQHHAAKVKKALELDDVRQWLACPSRVFQVWTWKKVGARWTPRVTSILCRDGKMSSSPFTLKG